jgi:hypothetical protein
MGDGEPEGFVIIQFRRLNREILLLLDILR